MNGETVVVIKSFFIIASFKNVLFYADVDA